MSSNICFLLLILFILVILFITMKNTEKQEIQENFYRYNELGISKLIDISEIEKEFTKFNFNRENRRCKIK